jgi:hypothetical protein
MKHVEFYSKNKFEKLVHLVGLIIRITLCCLSIGLQMSGRTDGPSVCVEQNHRRSDSGSDCPRNSTSFRNSKVHHLENSGRTLHQRAGCIYYTAASPVSLISCRLLLYLLNKHTSPQLTVISRTQPSKIK